MSETLLQKAKKSSNTEKYSDEEIELAIAWAKGEIRLVQVCEVIEKPTNGGYIFLAQRLKQAYNKIIL